jgi:alkanesulfonate monooxygenase SsuD/methylene tetrahydromethanopterin reductase-like flavin-dependent oxidoreductase (luciferase family)
MFVDQSSLGFGIVGSLDLEIVRAIAIRAEELGYHSLWVNDTPGGNSLERLDIAAQVTTRLVLATGVVSVDRIPPQQILEAIEQRQLPQERVILGIGSSAPPSPLSRIAEALDALRTALECPVIVGSLGPRMRRLGAEKGNGLLFNWLPPEHAARTTAQLREQAEAAGNAPVISATYVRTALGAEALPELEREAKRYSTIPSYAANFERLGIKAIETAVAATTADEVIEGLKEFDGTVDQVVLRAITPAHELEHYLRLLEAAAPLLYPGATSSDV